MYKCSHTANCIIKYTIFNFELMYVLIESRPVTPVTISLIRQVRNRAVLTVGVHHDVNIQLRINHEVSSDQSPFVAAVAAVDGTW